MTFERKLLTESNWKSARKKYITATDVPTLFGLNKYSTIKDIISKKEGDKEILINSYILVGQWLEPVVVKITNYLLNTNFKEPEGRLLICSNRYKLGATPDAESEDAFLECKTTNPSNILTWAYDPPLHYLLQLHTQLLCGNKKYGILTIQSTNFVQTNQILNLNNIIFKAIRNEQVDKLIIDEVDRFWDCYDSQKQFRVNKELGAKMTWLLKTNYQKIR